MRLEVGHMPLYAELDLVCLLDMPSIPVVYFSFDKLSLRSLLG